MRGPSRPPTNLITTTHEQDVTMDTTADLATANVTSDWFADGHFISAATAADAAEACRSLYDHDPSTVRPWVDDDDDVPEIPGFEGTRAKLVALTLKGGE